MQADELKEKNKVKKKVKRNTYIKYIDLLLEKELEKQRLTRSACFAELITLKRSFFRSQMFSSKLLSVEDSRSESVPYE